MSIISAEYCDASLLKNATGPVRYKLTNDYMFHVVFQQSPESLKHLLSALLDIPYDEIISCTLLNPIVLGDSIDEKNCILDIKILLNNGQLINLEMQAGNLSNWPDRALFYLCRLFCNIKKGVDYSEIKPAIHIGILTDSPFPDIQEFYSEYLLSNQKNAHIFSSKFALRVLDLSQLQNIPEQAQDTPLYHWAKLFTATTWEEIRMITEKNKDLTAAASYLHQLSEEEKIQLQCEARERYYMDMSSERKAGIKQGRNEAQELFQLLIAHNRLEDLKQATEDIEYYQNLLREYKIG
jgi:predicted transposase/invertase (TIGR01784 family)